MTLTEQLTDIGMHIKAGQVPASALNAAKRLLLDAVVAPAVWWAARFVPAITRRSTRSSAPHGARPTACCAARRTSCNYADEAVRGDTEVTALAQAIRYVPAPEDIEPLTEQPVDYPAYSVQRHGVIVYTRDGRCRIENANRRLASEIEEIVSA